MDTTSTYLLTFYSRNKTIDHVSEFTSEGEARLIMNKYNVIDSGEYFSRIDLSRIDSVNPGIRKKIAELHFM